MKNHNTILAIYPNGNGFGFALMQDAKNPIDSRTLEVRSKDYKKYLSRLEKLILYYRPTLLIVEDLLDDHKKSKRIEKLIQQTQILAREMTLPIKKYSRKQIQQTFDSFNAHTRYEIAKCISDWFPILGLKLPRAKKVWESDDYDMGAYDALSLAITHYYLE